MLRARWKHPAGGLLAVDAAVVDSGHFTYHVYDCLARGRALRLSDSLEPAYFKQLASERKVIRYTRGQPVRRWERKPGARAEALDCLVYAWAARHVVTVDLDNRASALEGAPPPTPLAAVISPWVSAW
jgi:phage terminase large subunit GpA-like protein